MEKAYLLIAGILTGAAVGLLSGRLTCWLAAGAVMGVILAVAARPSSKKSPPQSLKADS